MERNIERNIEPQERERIMNLGVFGYNAAQCAAVLGWELEEVENLLSSNDSEFFVLYEKGKIKADYIIDIKLFEQAQAGDLKSLDKLEMRKRLRQEGDY